MYQFFIEILIYFLSQIIDVNIDDVISRVKCYFPDYFGYFGS